VKVETEIKNESPPVEIIIMPRIAGMTARRIRRLASKTKISESRIGNMAAEAGIATVEKKFA
jgi:hypothetical protein